MTGRATVVGVGRDLRIIDPESIYHVIPVGSDKGPIVWDGHDCESLLARLAKAAMRYGWEVFAWCVMTTHYHVVLRTPEGWLLSGFQLLNGNHSRRTNRRHGRVAHLFKNRPSPTRVESDAHLVAAILYVVRNPLAAGLCEHASQWRVQQLSRDRRAGRGARHGSTSMALHELFGGPAGVRTARP